MATKTKATPRPTRSRRSSREGPPRRQRKARKRGTQADAKRQGRKRVTRRAAAKRGRPKSHRSRAAAGDLIDVTLTLLDVVRVPVQDPAAIFTFRRLQDNRQFSDQITRVLSGAPAVFSIPARASDVVLCELDLQRYRFARSDVFFRTPGVPVQRESLVFREPLEWTPDFTS